MTADLVSVIVPIYNVEKYLERCIASIVAQTWENMEIILVDDGSTDGSGAICDKWGERDGRVTVLHRKNGGLSDARNAGLDRAAGDYIVFVDSDDYVDPVLVSYCLAVLKRKRVDMVVYGYHRVDDAYNDLIACDVSKPREERVKKEDLQDLYLCANKIPVAVWSKFYKRKVWERLRFPVGRIYEDRFVMLDVLANADQAVISDKKLYYYRRRPGSITHVRNRKSYYDLLESYRFDCERLKKNRKLYNLVLSGYTAELMGLYEIETKRNRKKILKHFRRTMKFPVRHGCWKTAIVLTLFFIHPGIYEWLFVEHREEVRALERRLHIKYGDMPVQGDRRDFYS